MSQESRRRFLRVVGVGGMTGLVGCTGDNTAEDPLTNGSQDQTEQSAEGSGFTEFADALAAVSRPWQRTAREITDQMVEAVAMETADLLATTVDGDQTAALSDIADATETAFRQLQQGQKIFEMELLRSEMKAAVANTPDIKNAYTNRWNDDFSGIGRPYDTHKPYNPLYQVLIDDFRQLSNQNTTRARRIIRSHADSVDYILTTSRIFNRIDDHANKTGAKPLIKSLQFLKQSVTWIQTNLELKETATAQQTDTTGTENHQAWPMFQYDAGNTGSRKPGPKITNQPQEQWEQRIATGKKEERVEIHASPAVSGEIVYVGSWGNGVHAFDTADGTRLWHTQIDGQLLFSPAVANNTVFVGYLDRDTEAGELVALDALSGDEIWSVETGYIVMSPTVVEGTVYVGTGDEIVRAFDTDDGTNRWQVEVSGPVQSSPAIADGVVYAGSDDGIFYALDATDGEKVWTYDTGADYLYPSPVVADGTVYTVGLFDRVIAFAADDGAVQWEWRPSKGFPEFVDPVLDGQYLYVPGSEGIHALNISDGTEAWVSERDTLLFPTVDGDVIYASEWNTRTLVALRAADGEELWRLPLPTITEGGQTGVVNGSPAVDSNRVFTPLTTVETPWTTALVAFSR